METLDTGGLPSDAEHGRTPADRRALWLLLALVALAAGGVYLAWSAPANDDLRTAATEEEFLAALPEEWKCVMAPFSDAADIGVWAECDLDSEITGLTVVFKDEPTADREPIGAVEPVERCVFVGDHVTAAWSSVIPGLDVPAEESAFVADAFDGWERVEGEPPGCP